VDAFGEIKSSRISHKVKSLVRVSSVKVVIIDGGVEETIIGEDTDSLAVG
jgi:hypothetical protein